MGNDTEPGFINDNYTLLFPLKAYWDSSPAVIDAGTYNLPVGSGSAELVAVKYPAEGGGYTPGDTWELTWAKTAASNIGFTTAAAPKSQAS